MIKRIKSLLLSDTSKDAGVTMIGNVSITLAGMLFTVITARFLAPEKFGIFSALFALATLFGSLSDLGISSALVNFLPKVKSDRNLILSIIFWLQLIIAFILFCTALGFVPIRHLTLPGADLIHIFYLALLIIPLAFETFAISILRAEKHFTWVAAILSLDSWVKLIFTYLLLRFDLLNISSIFLASIAAASLATALGLSHEFKHIRRFFPKPQVLTIIKFAKWIALIRLFSVGISRIDVILLNAIGTSFDAGIFSAASRIALLFVLLVSSLGSVVAPRFSAFTTKNQVKSYLKKLTGLTLFVALGMLFSIALAPLIVNFVFGIEYQATIPVFRYLTLAMIPFLLAIITTNPLIYYFNKPDFVAKTTIVQVVTIIILDVLLIPQYGAIAPTISLGLANILVLGLTGYKLKQQLA